MSWKPSRSSRIVFDRHMSKSNKYRALIFDMIKSNEYLRFVNMKKFSRAIYLYWTNENYAHNSLCGETGSKELSRYSLEACCIYQPIYAMLLRNKEKCYKPLQKYIQA